MYPRRELEETMARWLQANRSAQAENDWVKHLLVLGRIALLGR